MPHANGDQASSRTTGPLGAPSTTSPQYGALFSTSSRHPHADFVVRPALDADATSIAALMEELGYPTSGQEMRRRLSTIHADPSFRTFVADRAGAVVGVAGVCVAPFYERNGMYGRLLALAVTDSCRSQGVGRALLDAAEKWIVERGGTTVVVGTGHHRERAHRFYERAGYVSTGLRYVKELR